MYVYMLFMSEVLTMNCDLLQFELQLQNFLLSNFTGRSFTYTVDFSNLSIQFFKLRTFIFT